MGNYTDFKLDVDISEEGMVEVLKLQNWMKLHPQYWYIEGVTTDEELNAPAPRYPYSTHKFFDNIRCDRIISNHERDICNSPEWTLEDNHLTIRTYLKDYANTIDEFLDWLSPYVIHESIEGYTLSDSDGVDRPLRWHDGKIVR